MKKLLIQHYGKSSHSSQQKYHMMRSSHRCHHALWKSSFQLRSLTHPPSDHKGDQIMNSIGIFGDIHFQDVGLQRVIDTGDWIYDQFRNQSQLSGIVCLGDVLNTRETVSVQSQSAAIHFFEKLSTLDVPIHILLGNHDMNLKHDSKISSLDVLGLNSLKNQFHLYRDIRVTDIGDQACVMFPYLEDQSLMKRWILDNGSKFDYSKMVGFGHLSLPGAIQRYQKDNHNKLFTKKYHSDDEMKGKKSLPSYLTRFKFLISGHFHHHHYLADNVLYCGSPMQHHFGDSGDSGRGICFLNKSNVNNSSIVEFVQNPTWDAFRLVRLHSEADLEPIEQYKGKFVSVIYENPDIVPDRIKDKLIKAGALQVKKHSIVVRRINQAETKSYKISQPEKINHLSFDDLIPEYLSLFDLSSNLEFKELLINKGREVMRNVATKLGSASPIGGNMFHAKLQSVTIENFLGIQGLIELNLSTMDDGVWFIEGNNGSGKSSLLEAITWCLFNRFLRTDMKASFAVNDVTKRNCRVVVKFENGYSIERFRKYSDMDTVELTNTPARKGNGIRVYKDNVYMSEYERGSLRDSQLRLEQLLGIDFNTFSKSVIVGESVFNFLSSDAKERREMIEHLLGLDQFDDFLNEVRLVRKKLQNDSIAQGYSIENLNQRLKMLRESLARTLTLEQALEQKRNAIIPSIDNCKVEIHDINHHIKQAEDQIASYQAFLSTKGMIQSRNLLIETLSVLNEKKQRMESKIQEYELMTQQYELASREIEFLEKDISESEASLIELQGYRMQEPHLYQEIRKLQEMIESHSCPYCSQSIEECTLEKLRGDLNIYQDSLHHATQQGELYEQMRIALQHKKQNLHILKQSQTKRMATTMNYSMIESDLKQIEAERNSRLEELEQISKQISESGVSQPLSTEDGYNAISSTLTNLRTQQLEKNKLFYHHRADLEHTNERLKEMSHAISTIHSQISDLEKSIENTNRSIAHVEDHVACYDFWEKAFERRTRKVDDLPISDRGSAYNSDPLPLPVMHTNKQVEKNQFITMRSFLLEQSIDDLNMILNEYTKLLGPNSMPVSFDYDFMIREDYGKRSAGQRKRNQLVIFFALFELVRQQSRFQSNFLMLDEVFDAIDKIGQHHVNEVIQMISSQHVDKVFIITHNMSRYKRTSEATGGEGCNFLIWTKMTNNGTVYEIS